MGCGEARDDLHQTQIAISPITSSRPELTNFLQRYYSEILPMEITLQAHSRVWPTMNDPFRRRQRQVPLADQTTRNNSCTSNLFCQGHGSPPRCRSRSYVRKDNAVNALIVGKDMNASQSLFSGEVVCLEIATNFNTASRNAQHHANA